jgi:hypothetical protein
MCLYMGSRSIMSILYERKKNSYANSMRATREKTEDASIFMKYLLYTYVMSVYISIYVIARTQAIITTTVYWFLLKDYLFFQCRHCILLCAEIEGFLPLSR